MNNQKSNDSLLTQAFDITVLGIFLTAVIALVHKSITGQNVVVICCFLAITYIWKLIWPVDRFRRYLWWQVLCIVMFSMSSWWLIYIAENTRTGWYRINVLQRRLQATVKTSPAYIIMANCDGYITATSDNIALLTGYTPKELLGQQVTILMRDGPAAKHQISYDKTVVALRAIRSFSDHQGWLMQGLITVGIKHKNGHLVPVIIYAGGIRWSTDIQFDGDIDMFALFIPVPVEQATKGRSNIDKYEPRQLQQAPPPPPVPTFIPVPTPVPVPSPPAVTIDQ